MDLIISHKNCADGWAAAFVTKKRYPEAEILLLDHGTPAPYQEVRGKDVLVLDFSWPNREDNIKLHDSAKSFQIFDHHKTAQDVLRGLPFATFDMTRSGAGLAWDYLFGCNTIHTPETHGKPRPFYVSYVEDRDLWNWALPGSKAVNAYLMSLPMTIEAWSELDLIKVEYAEQFGIGILRHIDRYVKQAVQEAQFGKYWFQPRELTVAVCNVPYMNCSEIGNVLAEQADFSLTWFERADGMLNFSLRSIGNFDVSEIAKIYHGGGHKNAAGFRLTLQHGRNFLDSILGR